MSSRHESTGLRLITAMSIVVWNVAVTPDAFGQRSSTGKASSSAQIRGRVLGVFDEATGEPVVGADVTDRFTGDHALTSETGTISLWFVRQKGSVVEIRKLGYEPWSSVVDPTDTVPITVLLRHAVALAPVVTTAKPDIWKDPGLRDGFERRCQASHVSCFREGELQAHPNRTLGDFVLQSDGVKMACGRGARANVCGLAMHALAGPGNCTPTYIVDGFAWDTKALGPPIDQPPPAPRNGRLGPPPFNVSNVKQVEVYASETARPSRFQGDPTCGVVAIWTK